MQERKTAYYKVTDSVTREVGLTNVFWIDIMNSRKAKGVLGKQKKSLS